MDKSIKFVVSYEYVDDSYWSMGSRWTTMRKKFDTLDEAIKCCLVARARHGVRRRDIKVHREVVKGLTKVQTAMLDKAVPNG